ncbi:MAG: prolipoprotein diacylglyceryl transferase [bacterium]
MHPILFKIGPFTVYTYGFFIAVAFITGIFWASREAERLGEEPEKIMDLGFYLIISAIIGARLLFVFLNVKEYLAHPLNIFKIWEGGLVFHGGLIFGLLAGFLYVKGHHLSIWKFTDIIAPALALGQSIGRIGCLMAGCCYGKETTCPWGIVFTDPNSLAVQNVHLHPTQIYSSVCVFSLFIFLLWLRKRKSFEGQIFWTYVALYSVARFIIDFFRGDELPAFFHIFSFTQVLSLALFISALYSLWIFKRKALTRP